METITKEELKTKLENKDDHFKLLFTMGQWPFDLMRIPGSLHVDSLKKFTTVTTDKDEDIVVYCSNVACLASKYAYRKLVESGFTHVRRYEGGISEWEAAGYPVEGEMV